MTDRLIDMEATHNIIDTPYSSLAHFIEVNGVQSEKVSWMRPATLTIDGVMYVAFTDYYEGILPTNQVLKLVPLGDDIANTSSLTFNGFTTRSDEHEHEHGKGSGTSLLE